MPVSVAVWTMRAMLVLPSQSSLSNCSPEGDVRMMYGSNSADETSTVISWPSAA